MKKLIMGLTLLASMSSFASSNIEGDYSSTVSNDECRDMVSVQPIQGSNDVRVVVRSTRNCYLKSNHLSIPRDAEIIFTPAGSKKEGIISYVFKSSPSEISVRGSDENFDSYGCAGTTLTHLEGSDSIHINFCSRKVGFGVQGRARLESMGKLYLKN